MADYKHLIGKPVVAVPSDGRASRGIFEEDKRLDHPWVRAFNGRTAGWQDWKSLVELPFCELTKDELLDWLQYDPSGYLLAGVAWANEVNAKRSV